MNIAIIAIVFQKILSFVEIERLARWHSAQTRLMWLGFLDTAQRHFVEAQASSVKVPFFVHPATVATSQQAIDAGSVHLKSHVLSGRCISVAFRLADTVVRFRYCVQKIAIFTMVVPGIY